MRLILLGPPGGGKGTQGKMLAARLAVPHISTGDILRQEIETGTDLGRKARALIDKGNLVSDAMINAIVHQRLRLPDVAHGFILDGYPRTVPQALKLEEVNREFHMPLDAALDLEVDETELIRRISGRRVCSGCGATFHLTSMPPIQPTRCDHCGSPLTHREDDAPEAIRRRLQIYRLRTQPLIDFYRDRKILFAVDTRRGVEHTFEAILRILGLDLEPREDL